MKRPNILLIMTDQKRLAPPYEWKNSNPAASNSSPKNIAHDGISFESHYIGSAASAPSRATFLTGQFPSLHGVSQTDGLAKNATSKDMFWLAPDSVPTMGDWFRAGGYKTYYKGKWHVSHVGLETPDGKGHLPCIENDGTPIPENIAAYAKADLLDPFGFSEWIGPEPHGLGKANTGTGRDVFTADETITLLKRSIPSPKTAPGSPSVPS